MQPGLRNQIQRWIAKTDLSVRAPGAEWDVELETYRLSEITRIDFGGDYEDALNLYGGCKYRRALQKIEELKNLPKFTSEEKRAGKMPALRNCGGAGNKLRSLESCSRTLSEIAHRPG